MVVWEQHQHEAIRSSLQKHVLVCLTGPGVWLVSVCLQSLSAYSSVNPFKHLMSNSDECDAHVFVPQFTICRIPRSREVHQSWSSSVVSTLDALRYSLPLVFRLRPDMVSGAGCSEQWLTQRWLARCS